MSNGCSYRNPLVRNGVSQPARYAAELDPGFVKVDERTLMDLLQFILDYAEDVQYFDSTNRPAGHWRVFFERDVSTIIAMIAKQSAAGEKNCFFRLKEIIEDETSSKESVKKAFKILFELAFTIAHDFNFWYKQSVEGLAFNAFLTRVAGSRLRQPLITLIGYYKGAAETLPLWDETDTTGVCEITTIGWEQLKSANMYDIWWSKAAAEAWPELVEGIPADEQIYDTGTASASGVEKIRSACSRVAHVVEEFINALVYIINEAPLFVEDSLKNHASHEPHMGLLLTFFELFRTAQDHINTLTRRHLDYYYREVLKLRPKDAVPDTVHLIAELAKHADEFQIKPGMLLKAGKDEKGMEVVYQTDRERVINRASIAEMKTVFIALDNDSRVYAAPVANSADGQGAPLDDPSDGWRAFGQPQPVPDPLTGEPVQTMTDAGIGFAVSSPILELREGMRTITLRLELENSLTSEQKNALNSSLFNYHATGEKNWIELQEFLTTQEITPGDKSLKFELKLNQETPAIAAWQPELHLGRYDTPFPVLRIELRPDQPSYAYRFLKGAVVTGIGIDVDVDDVRNLVLQNELGVLDPSKPFAPFGSVPVRGSQFYIGSREVFSKALSELTLHFKWHEWPEANLNDHYKNYGDYSSTTNADFLVDVQLLKAGTWPRIAEEKQLFPGSFTTDPTFDNDITLSPGFADSPEPALPPFQEYATSLKRGFLRLKLSAPEDAFGHKLYPVQLTSYATTEPRSPAGIPAEPYTPKISDLALGYKASIHIDLKSSTDFEERVDRFYHLYPFGQAEIHSNLVSDPGTLRLFPRFKHDVDSKESIHQGEFFIGLHNCDPPRSISLLFRVAEGSADPKLDKAEPSWFYLAGNEWVKLRKGQDYSDATNELLQTGIISFNIPREATANDSIIITKKPTHWLKASISAPPASVCKIIDVKPQAVTATFKDQGNDPDFLATPLPAGTIKKLKEPRAEIKKIDQPYASFGGKIHEQNPNYYRRVSERLRHKDRGIAIWDYERLVLETFAGIYKVKCINHGTYEFTEPDGSKTTAEFAPGYVAVVVVPDLTNQNAVNPLEPRVSLGKLDEIANHIKTKLSPFAAEKLQVINPLFEQIQVEFFVEFKDVSDEGFYEEKLKEDIKAFLSPWAFGKPEAFSFGGRVYKSVILNYVEELEYVDYVTDFRMHHYVEGTKKAGDVDEISATTARSVLVSYQDHEILATSS